MSARLPEPPRPVVWRCPLCLVNDDEACYLPLPALWQHLRDVHGWDRERYWQQHGDTPVERDEVA